MTESTPVRRTRKLRVSEKYIHVQVKGADDLLRGVPISSFTEMGMFLAYIYVPYKSSSSVVLVGEDVCRSTVYIELMESGEAVGYNNRYLMPLFNKGTVYVLRNGIYFTMIVDMLDRHGHGTFNTTTRDVMDFMLVGLVRSYRNFDRTEHREGKLSLDALDVNIVAEMNWVRAYKKIESDWLDHGMRSCMEDFMTIHGCLWTREVRYSLYHELQNKKTKGKSALVFEASSKCRNCRLHWDNVSHTHERTFFLEFNRDTAMYTANFVCSKCDRDTRVCEISEDCVYMLIAHRDRGKTPPRHLDYDVCTCIQCKEPLPMHFRDKEENIFPVAEMCIVRQESGNYAIFMESPLPYRDPCGLMRFCCDSSDKRLAAETASDILVAYFVRCFLPLIKYDFFEFLSDHPYY